MNLGDYLAVERSEERHGFVSFPRWIGTMKLAIPQRLHDFSPSGLRNRLPLSIPEPLAEGARRHFDPAFRMSGSLACPVAYTFHVVERRVIAGKVQQAILQHRPLAGFFLARNSESRIMHKDLPTVGRPPRGLSRCPAQQGGDGGICPWGPGGPGQGTRASGFCRALLRRCRPLLALPPDLW